MVQFPHSELTRLMQSYLQAGQAVPDDLCVLALERALLDVHCCTRGWGVCVCVCEFKSTNCHCLFNFWFPNPNATSQIDHQYSICKDQPPLYTTYWDVEYVHMEILCGLIGYTTLVHGCWNMHLWTYMYGVAWLATSIKAPLPPSRYVLDGWPLTKAQVELLAKFHITPVCIVELEVSDQEVLRRGEGDRNAPDRWANSCNHAWGLHTVSCNINYKCCMYFYAMMLLLVATQMPLVALLLLLASSFCCDYTHAQ